MILDKNTISYIIDKLYKLKVKTEFEDRIRGKIRWITKRSAYNDLIKFMEDLLDEDN